MMGILGLAGVPPSIVLLIFVLIGTLVTSLVLARFRQSLMAGYFLVGVVIANSGLTAFTGGTHEIELFAEIGVVLLMFTLGVEFSRDEARHLKRAAMVGGGWQMGLAVLVFSLLCGWLAGLDAVTSVVLGCILALSSTAVALKSFQEVGLAASPASRSTLGIALSQDLLAILLMAILPALYSGAVGFGDTAVAIGGALLRGVCFVVAAFLLGKYVLPKLLNSISRTRSRELFTLMVVCICGSITLLGAAMELSLAMGAFTAGLVVSGSYFSQRVLSEIMPFKDLFLTLFFVSVGLRIDLPVLAQLWHVLLLAVVFCVVVKFLVALVATQRLKLTSRMAALCAISLANVGEFSLVLVTLLQSYTTIPEDLRQIILTSAAVSMGITPSIMKFSLKHTQLIDSLPFFRQKHVMREEDPLIDQIKHLTDHVIICGYGPVGQRLNATLHEMGIPTIIIDINAQTVRELLKSGQPAIFGDVRHSITLSLANIDSARMIAFTFPDITAVQAALPEISARNSAIFIQARAKFPAEVATLRDLGITRVVHDEAESGKAMSEAAIECFEL